MVVGNQDPSVLEFQRRFQDQLDQQPQLRFAGSRERHTGGCRSPHPRSLPTPSSAICSISHDYEPLLGCFGDWIGRMQSTPTKRWRAQPAAYAAPLGSLTSSPAPPTPTDS